LPCPRHPAGPDRHRLQLHGVVRAEAAPALHRGVIFVARRLTYRMLAYALRRLVLAVPLLLGITLISFVVIHLVPGEPVDLQTGDLSVQSSAQAKQLLREVYGLDKPLTVQYWNWLGRLARLD